jgi:hypothetical protein
MPCYRKEAAPDLPCVQLGLCGFCYRRSLAASLSSEDRAYIHALAVAGDWLHAMDAVTRLLPLSPGEACAVAHELSKNAEPLGAPDRGGDR